MNWWDQVGQWANDIGNFLTQGGNDLSELGQKLTGYVTSIWNSIGQYLDNPITGLEKAAADESALLSRVIMTILQTIQRVEGYVENELIDPLKTWTEHQISELRAEEWQLIQATWTLIYQVNAKTETFLLARLSAEQQARIQGDQQAEAYTRASVTQALALIQQEAASGYRATLQARSSVLVRLADELVTRDPIVRDIVGQIIRYALDAASIDNPVLRLTAGFLLRDVINHLGLDKAIGDLLNSLLEPILGQGPPTNLHDVISSIGTRLNAIESEWAQFMTDGGPEILQAGEEWKALTSILTDTSLAAFFGLMTAEPQAAARDMAEAATPIIKDTVTAVTDAMKLWR